MRPLSFLWYVYLLLAGVGLSLSGCRGGGPRKDSHGVPVVRGHRPDWVDGSSRQYPRQQYLTAVGFAPERGTAEENARAELARIFRTHVQSTMRSYEDYLRKNSGRTEDTTDSLSLQNLTTVTTNKVIEGSEIGAAYYQRKPPLVYALAVLDRAKSGRILRARIGKLDGELSALLAQSKSAADPLQKLRYLKRAVPKFALREATNTEFRIVNSSGMGLPSEFRIESVQSEIDGLLAGQLAVGVLASGPAETQLRTAAMKVLSALGLPVIAPSTGKAFDLRVELASSLNLSKRTQEFFDARWSLRSKLVGRGGKELSTAVKNGGGGYITREQAERMATEEMQRSLAQLLQKQVDDFLMGPSQPVK